MAAMAVQGQAMLRTAEVVRDYVNIRAPGAGHVVKRLVAPGVLVQPGMAVLKIAQIDRVRLQANVGEKDLAGIKVGSPVTVTTTAAGQAPIPARVTSVFPFVDQGPRTAVVEAVVDNPGRQYVMMQFTTGERARAVTVPRSAVARLGGKGTVWVVTDGRAEPRAVTTGLEGPDRIEIAQGLAAGEPVVARGHEGLYVGARVIDAARRAAPGGDAPKRMPGMSEPTTPAPSPSSAPAMPGMDMPGASGAPAQPGPAPSSQTKEGPRGRR
jgi:RND family efflux transporter MFP subunit